MHQVMYILPEFHAQRFSIGFAFVVRSLVAALHDILFT